VSLRFLADTPLGLQTATFPCSRTLHCKAPVGGVCNANNQMGAAEAFALPRAGGPSRRPCSSGRGGVFARFASACGALFIRASVRSCNRHLVSNTVPRGRAPW
jgi:hypothetical protein